MMGLLIFLAVVLSELALMCWLGDRLLEAWLGRGTFRRLPELAFVFGFCACAVVGQLALYVAGAAQAVLPVLIGLGMLMELRRWYRSRSLGQPPSEEEPLEAFSSYLQFRASRLGTAVLVFAILFAVLLPACRMPWLLGMHDGGKVISGTHIFDDVRNIGYPIALAAFGYPLRSPLQAELVLAYPVASFATPAAFIAWLPQAPLSVVAADDLVLSLFCSLTLVLAVSLAASAPVARALGVFAGLVCTSFNLWALHPNPEAPLFDALFGFHRWTRNYSTIAWAHLSGLIWVPNHLTAAFAMLLGGVLFWACLGLGKQAPTARLFSVALVPVLYAVFASTDVAVMMTSAGAAVLAFLAWRVWHTDGNAARNLLLGGGGLCVCAFLAFLLVQARPLSGLVDGPVAGVTERTNHFLHNLGVLASSVGAYFILIPLLLRWIRDRGWRAWAWLVPPAMVMLFALYFGYITIWFWRSILCLHSLLALAAAALLSRLWEQGSAGKAVRGALVWAVLLIPGMYQTTAEFNSTRWLYAPRVSPAHAEAATWIQEHTSLSDRVVEFRPDTFTLVSSMEYLRAGNQSGEKLSERVLPLMGFRGYAAQMAHLIEGIQENDYIIDRRGEAGLSAVLLACGAGIPYQNAEVRVFHVQETCRGSIDSPAVSAADQRLEDTRAPGRNRASLAIPEYDIDVRRQAEVLWSKGQYAEAVAYLKRALEVHPSSAEVHYSLAWSLQAAHKPAEAIDEYSTALKLGYYEFWVRYARGTAYASLGKKDLARQDLERATQLDPTHADARKALADLGK